MLQLFGQLGFQQRGRAAGGTAPYTFVNAEAEAIVAAFTVEPDDTRKGHIDTLVGALKTAGVWAKTFQLAVHAAHDEQAGAMAWLLNGNIAPGPFTITGAPAFTVDQGYLGNAGTANVGGVVLDAAYRDNMHLSAYAIEATSSTTGDATGSTSVLLRIADTPAFKVNFGTTRSGSAGTGRHYVCGVRPDGSQHILYVDGEAGVAFADASSADPATMTWARNTTRTMAIFSAGEALSDVEKEAQRLAFRTYLQAIGAGVP